MEKNIINCQGCLMGRMSRVTGNNSWDLARKWPFENLVQGFRLRARYEGWERDEWSCKWDVKTTESGGYMEKRQCNVPALVPIFQSSSWQNLDGPGAWGAPQDLLYSCFRKLFLSHHWQTCSQLRAQKRWYPLLAARQWEVQSVKLLNFTEGGLDFDRDLLSKAF